MKEAKSFRKETEKKYGFKEWDFEKEYEFTDRAGNTFKLQLDDIMEIYAASRRKQALDHLLKGGFTYEQGRRTGLLTEKTGAGTHPLDLKTIVDITSTLNEKQKGFVEDMQKYLSQVMAKKGNEVSMALYGVELFTEDTYWSIKSSDSFLDKKTEDVGKYRRKNAGFTKAVTPNASNPIVLRGFEKNWSHHVNEMSLYHGMTLPLENFSKVLNYRTATETEQNSIKNLIKGVYGNAIYNEVEQLLEDANGNITGRARLESGGKLVTNMKMAETIGKSTVVVQQPTAVFRAMAKVNPIYFAKTLKKELKVWEINKQWEEIQTYAPIAIIKDMGGFDTGSSRSAAEYLGSGKLDGKLQKVNKKTNDVLSQGAAYGDRIAWIHIWHAVQAETQKEHGLKIGTQENLIKSGERFNEVIVDTQVYDSTLAKSSAMRSKNTWDVMLTTFMGEPIKTLNMTLHAIYEAKKVKGVKAKSAILRPTLVATAASIVSANMLVAFLYAPNDRDEDETYWEKYWQAVGSGLISDFNPLTYLPFARDVVSLFNKTLTENLDVPAINGFLSLIEGYDVERADLSLINDVFDIVGDILKEGVTPENIFELTMEASALCGSGIKNIAGEYKRFMNLLDIVGEQKKNKLEKLTAQLPTTYQASYNNNWYKGYTEAECEDKARQSARAKIGNELRDDYKKYIKNKNMEKAQEIRLFMHKSGYYDGLTHVDETLKGWREALKEEQQRDERAKSR
jgi:hypothetical protein